MAFVGAAGVQRGQAARSRNEVVICRAEDAPSGGAQTPVLRTRREVLSAAAALLAAAGVSAAAPAAFAQDAAVAPPPPPPVEYKFDFRLTGDYKADATAVLGNMRSVTGMARGTPGMADNVAGTRKSMNEFVAQYRRNGKVSGSVSFSTLYTAINTLSGHFQSYGNSYPVPEKRRKRLNAQYVEIEKALARGR
eukprot:CAMPEP_0185844374 /NCGR_PEP_ID=MMETSP1354-20130828/563_1 /TAXON_ID=708628 /ORGANISM="Erythrolobus madagascarensis, Strain CCMP3276" /LENGTH=192 /DNA_ID=CAMNT_0028544027 /DNA_START=123 /DNA_END=701 /DNA_ORIENTATION=-